MSICIVINYESKAVSFAGRVKPHLLPLLALLSATLLVYGRILGHDFQLTWDDDHYILDNLMVHGLTLSHVRQAFSGQYFGNYAPLHIISYMLDFELWKFWPGGYLLVNLLIHAVNGLLLYRIVLMLHGRRLMAVVGAGLFLLHPLQVETVAWVSQRKNLLAMLFFLLAWESYRLYREAGGRARIINYSASFLFYCCALLSKSAAVIFPLVIMLHDHCFAVRRPEQVGDTVDAAAGSRWSMSGLLDKVPFILATAAAVWMTVASQVPAGDNWDGAGGGRTSYHGGSMLATFYSMLPVFCSYLKLLVWPSGLNAQYDPPVYASLNTAVAAAGLFLLLIGWCCFRLFRSDRKAGFWALLFWIGFLPVSQIVPLVTMMNDRYVYFPMIGSAVLAGFGVTLLQDRLPPRLVPASYLFVSAILVAVAVTSFQRAGVWKNSVTLWSDSVAREPGRAMSWVSLAQALERTGEGNVPAAIEAYNRAAALDPANAYVQYGLARIYGFTGQYEKALQHVTALLRQWPDHVMGLTLLGTIRQKQGDLDGAEQILLRAAALQPDAVEVAMLLAEVSMLKADLKMARSRYLDIENRLGKFPVTAYMLGWIALREGGIDSALEWLEKAFARGYADYRSADDLQEMTALYGNPRFEKLLRRYGGRK